MEELEGVWRLYGSSSICLKKKINFKAFLSTSSFIGPNDILVVQ